jgi:UDPglucose--hexose-1-phosphate uridylyltransferase
MSELRHDDLTGTWTLLAPGRRGIGAMRPAGLPDVALEACPFCPGREAETEEATLALGDPWVVRVVANRYPLVAPRSSLTSEGARPASGLHEVVIESRDHDADLATYDPGHAALVLRAIRARLRTIEAMPGLAAISVFRNRGRRAGSSQPHPHSQLVALDHVPPAIALRAARAEAGAHIAIEIARERIDGARVVEDRGGVIAYCPFASHRAWETRLALDAAVPRLSALDDALLDALAAALVRTTARLRRALGAHDYNVLVRDPPIGAPDARAFFVIDILPRTGGDAGFELGSGTPVCVVAPEDAAAALRDA